MSLKGEKEENFIRKRALTSKDERNIKETIITNQALKNENFLGKSPIVLAEKTTISVGYVEKYVIIQRNAKIRKITGLLRLWVVLIVLSLARKKH